MNLDRRSFLKISGSTFALVAMPGLLKAAENGSSVAGRKPNILYILCDQWRAQALSCAGDKNLKTPNIDKLAAAGLNMTNAYSNSPVCTPHRAILMSGKFPSRTKVWENNTLLAPAENCIAEVFASGGYSTGYIGKWHLDGPEKPGSVKHRQGWQYWAGFNRGHAFNNGVYFTDSEKPIKVAAGVFEPVHQTDLAIDFMDKNAKQDNPWFLVVSYGGPHMPYTAPDKYMKMIDPDKFDFRPNVPESQKKNRKALHGYYAHCLCLDDCVGRLVEKLDSLKLADNTIVCFTSDHGDMHGSQDKHYKCHPWEESIGVPFITRWPKAIPAGQKSSKVFSSVDIFPTLCGLCGVDKPAGLDGMDISPLFMGKSSQVPDIAYLTIGDPDKKDAWRGIRTPQYTYAYYPNNAKGYVLYDNNADPYQMNNMIDKPEHKDLQQKLHGQLVAYMKKINEPLASKMG